MVRGVYMYATELEHMRICMTIVTLVEFGFPYPFNITCKTFQVVCD